MTTRGRVLLLKTSVWVACLLPLGWGLWRLFFGDGLGANPIEEAEHLTGDATLTILLATLAVTPVRRLTGWNILAKVRRPMGLFAFFYASVHLSVYVGLDQFFGWSFIVEDIAERPYILVGFTAFLLLLPLAVTSTRGWIRRLGRNWQRLHRLVYVASALGVLHFLWVTKADDRWPFVAAGAWGVLMGLRVFWSVRSRRRPARSSSSAASGERVRKATPA